jgi:hypothetical protein
MVQDRRAYGIDGSNHPAFYSVGQWVEPLANGSNRWPMVQKLDGSEHNAIGKLSKHYSGTEIFDVKIYTPYCYAYPCGPIGDIVYMLI